MTAEVEGRGARWLMAGALAAGVVALIAASAARMATAELANHNPRAALKWDSGNPIALASLASTLYAEQLQAGHDAQAIAYAKAALRAAPLDATAPRVLALEAEKAGDAGRALTLMKVGDRRSRRDLLTGLWLFAHADQDRDWSALARHADALLRQEWRLQPVLYPVMIRALDDPAAAAPLARRLAYNPDWRGPFTAALTEVDPAAAGRLFEVMAANGWGPNPAEGTRLIGAMVDGGDYAGARAEWARLLPPGAPAAGALVYNGDFKTMPGDPPFNWSLTGENGAVSEYAPAGDGAPALHVLAPASASQPLAGQLLTLPPGAYSLSGKVSVAPGEAGPLFSWRVTCAGGGAALDQTDLAADPPGWRPFTATFTVPSAGCPAQWLWLTGLAHDGFDPAEAWWRGMAVTALGPPHA